MEGHCGNPDACLLEPNVAGAGKVEENDTSSAGRPFSISSSIRSDDSQSDNFSGYDSRRSTISSVCTDSPQQHQHQQNKPSHDVNSTSNVTTCASPTGSGSTPHFSNSPQPWNNNTQGQAEQSSALPASPASQYNPSPLTRNRENARQLHEARLERQRSASDPSTGSRRLRGKRGARNRTFQPANPKAALAATEPPHENLLTKMAFAEQQRWITVQQKTFTKWLNTKIEARGFEVADLVKDLSDGVGAPLQSDGLP